MSDESITREAEKSLVPEKPPVPEKNSYFDFPDKIEGFIAGLLAYFGRYLLTLLDLGFRQQRFTQHFNRNTHTQHYLKPFTLLTIQAFITIRVFRIIFAGVALFSVSLFRGCGGDTLVEVKTPEVLTEFSLPSFEEIVFIGVPMVLGTFLLGWLVRWLLIKDGAQYKNFAELTSYSVSFQYASYIAVCLVLALFTVVDIPFSEHIDIDDSQLGDFLVQGLVLLLFLAWPVIVFYRLVTLSIPRAAFRVQRKVLRQSWLCFCATLIILGTSAIGFAVAYPFAKKDIAGLEQEIPVISVVLLHEEIIAVDQRRLTVLTQNNSDGDLWLKTPTLGFGQDDNYQVTIEKGMGDIEHGAFLLAKGQSRTLVMTMKKRDPSVRDACPLFSDCSKQYSISFESVTHLGETAIIKSRIRLNKDESWRGIE